MYAKFVNETIKLAQYIVQQKIYFSINCSETFSTDLYWIKFAEVGIINNSLNLFDQSKNMTETNTIFFLYDKSQG